MKLVVIYGDYWTLYHGREAVLTVAVDLTNVAIEQLIIGLENFRVNGHKA